MPPNTGMQLEGGGIMYGDSHGAQETALFREAESGVGMSPSCRVREEEQTILEVVSSRLVRARRAAGFREWEVSQHLGHANLTMISLFENGRRAPSLRNLVMLASMYGVTTDYLLGLTDDLGLSPEEGNQALLVGIIKGSLSGHMERFVDAISRATAITVEGIGKDRALLERLAEMAEELSGALQTIQRHHGSVFEQLRGGATLLRLVGELNEVLSSRIQRKQLEKRLADYEHPVCSAKDIEQAVQHALFA